jgi:hypothetical protein
LGRFKDCEKGKSKNYILGKVRLGLGDIKRHRNKV